MLVWMYDQSILAPWLALVIRSLPLATLVVWQALRTIPQEMLESGAVDGAGPLRRLWSIALPCRLSAVALAWVVALAVALGDLGASILVVPPGVTTVSIRVFGLLHAGQEPEVAGICLALIGLLAAVALVAASLLGRWCHPGAAE
jgi:iron(III) transport system permease protein